MKTENRNLTDEQQWAMTCREQGWNEASQIIHLEGFLRSKGLFAELAAYAQKAAAEEIGDVRGVLLEDLGYGFNPDPDQEGLWVWVAPTDACEVSFSTRAEAVEAAWVDAVGQTKAICNMPDGDWDALGLEQQLSLVREALGGDDTEVSADR